MKNKLLKIFSILLICQVIFCQDDNQNDEVISMGIRFWITDESTIPNDKRKDQIYTVKFLVLDLDVNVMDYVQREYIKTYKTCKEVHHAVNEMFDKGEMSGAKITAKYPIDAVGKCNNFEIYDY